MDNYINNPREELSIKLINIFFPILEREQITDIKLNIDLVLNDYEIEDRHTELAVITEGKNEWIIKKFAASKIASGRSKRTVKYYIQSVSTFLETVNKDYDEITADDIRVYLAKRINIDKVTKTTANNERRNVSAFYTWLQTEEILLKNPMKKVDPIKAKKEKKKAFTDLEMERIRNSCRTNREKAIIEILASTWCRVSEVCQIELSDINDNEVLVHGKGDKDRIVYLNAKAQIALEAYLNDRKDSNPYLFPRAKYAGDVAAMTKNTKKAASCEWYKRLELVAENGEMDKGTIESIVRNIGKRAGVENTHPHRFRRTGATMALRSGMSLITVSKLLGHQNIGVTQIYLDISDDELEEAHKRYVR